MAKIGGLGFMVVFLACSSSTSSRSTDAAKQDGASNPAVTADVGPDPRAGDVAKGPDSLARDLAADPFRAADGAGDTSPKLDLPAADRGRSDSSDSRGRSDIHDANAITDVVSSDVLASSDLGEPCSCGDTQVSGPVAVSWGCFCSVESCTRTLADFLDDGTTDRYFKTNQTVRLVEYAGCNRILVQDYTYSRQVPASDYVFDRTTKALVGAKVWLDDRQHTCPFPASGARWVFGYQAGSYPVPSTCQATACVSGSGTCPL